MLSSIRKWQFIKEYNVHDQLPQQYHLLVVKFQCSISYCYFCRSNIFFKTTNNHAIKPVARSLLLLTENVFISQLKRYRFLIVFRHRCLCSANQLTGFHYWPYPSYKIIKPQLYNYKMTSQLSSHWKGLLKQLYWIVFPTQLGKELYN